MPSLLEKERILPFETQDRLKQLVKRFQDSYGNLYGKQLHVSVSKHPKRACVQWDVFFFLSGILAHKNIAHIELRIWRKKITMEYYVSLFTLTDQWKTLFEDFRRELSRYFNHEVHLGHVKQSVSKEMIRRQLASLTKHFAQYVGDTLGNQDHYTYAFHQHTTGWSAQIYFRYRFRKKLLASISFRKGVFHSKIHYTRFKTVLSGYVIAFKRSILQE